VPYKVATDEHQKLNAIELKKRSSFFIQIIDSNKSNEEISLDIQKTINEIQQKNMFKTECNITNKSAAIKITETICGYLK
jgi:hypothetical protein